MPTPLSSLASTTDGPAAGFAAPSVILQQFLASALVLQEDWDLLAPEKRQEISACTDPERLLNLLVDHGLLTDYQAGRIEAGTTFGLILGNYRILDRLGAGGMGVVFRAEHVRLRKIVAIKVLPMSPENDPRLLRRFFTEIRSIAQLQHPNIVGAMDAGECEAPEGRGTVLHFFVMEYVPGQDLEQYVNRHGTLAIPKACDLMHQVASALAEANKHNLVHRDIKPSNIQLTPEGQAKLLDFGLARHFKSGMTEHGTLLGTLDYMAPEQIQDARAVDIRADLYGLGGVLYWCLTGQSPFPSKGDVLKDLTARLNQPPPSLIAKRPDAPAELQTIIQRMMAMNRAERYPTPEAVMTALLPFLTAEEPGAAMPVPVDLDAGGDPAEALVHHVLIVDDQPTIRSFCRLVLQAEGLQCDEAEGGRQALEMLAEKDYDVVLLDINMPDLNGTEVCRLLRENPPCPNLKIIMSSGGANGDVMAQMLLSGADDFITKPFSVVQLQSRIKAALRFKAAQDRSEMLTRHLLAVNQELAQNLGTRDSQAETRSALVLGLTKLVEHRSNESAGHLVRMQKFCRCLAEEAARVTPYASQLTPEFIEMLESCAPLHDIGNVGLPDHILLKPGKLDAEERAQMQAHTIIGASALSGVSEAHGSSLGFLQIATDIVRHHHERWDGTGYPDRLAGDDIPLAARIVHIADVYDALRTRRAYKAALAHPAAIQVMQETGVAQFDPTLLQVLQRVAPQFDRIFQETPDR